MYMIKVHTSVHPMTLFQDSVCDSNLVCGDVQTKGGRMKTKSVSMTMEATKGVQIAFENFKGTGSIAFVAGSFKMGPQVSHFDPACIGL